MPTAANGRQPLQGPAADAAPARRQRAAEADLTRAPVCRTGPQPSGYHAHWL